MSRLVISIMAVAFAFAALGVMGARTASAATVTVCQSGCTYTSIQSAIDASNPGDTIKVKSGTYTENIVVTKALTIDGAGEDHTKIRPAISGPTCAGGSICPGGSNVVLVQASNVTISDLTIDGDNPALTSGVVVGGKDLDARNGIITDHTLGVYNNLEVARVTVKNVYLRGMYASSGGTFNFHDNTVENVQADPASIAMFNFGGLGTMARNTVSDANDAISSNHSRGVQFLDNEVRRSGSGVHTDNAGDGGGSPDLIKGNRVSDCKPDGYGVWVFVPYLAPVVQDNDVRDCAVGLGAFGGAFSGPTATTVFTGNSVEGKKNSGVGIWVSTTTFGFGDANVAASFDHNSVRGFETGILVEQATGVTAQASFDQGTLTKNDVGASAPSGSLAVTGSCVQKNDVGLLATGTGVLSAHNSIVSKNKDFGAQGQSATAIDATGNYWGHKTGPKPPGKGDKIDGNVTFAGFLADAPFKCKDVEDD